MFKRVKPNTSHTNGVPAVGLASVPPPMEGQEGDEDEEEEEEQQQEEQEEEQEEEEEEEEGEEQEQGEVIHMWFPIGKCTVACVSFGHRKCGFTHQSPQTR